MNPKLTAAAGIAVIFASTSEFFLISGVAWLVTAIGAVTVVALAGTLTRLAPWPAALGATVLSGLVAVPMIASPGAAWKAVAAAIIVCCAASGTRWRPLRVVAGLVTYLAALLLYLNAVRASSQSIGLIVPTQASLHHLVTLANSGMAQAKFPPPVQQTPGVIVLAAGSIGLAAIVIDFLAVRLHRPAIAGLPLLVIYLAPLATAAHVQGPWGITAFLIAATGYLGLLASDGRTRLRGWGRVISVWHSPGENERIGGADVTALAATGRRIGVAAVCVAIIAPLLLPTLNLHKLFAGQASGPGRGAITLPDPVVQMRGLLSIAQPQTVLTYRSDTANPGQYLQVFVLDYDPQKRVWTIIQPGRRTAVRSGTLPQPPGLASYVQQGSTTLHVSLGTTVGYSSGSLLFLPVPYWPEQVAVSGTWWESDDTQMIFSDRSDQQVKSYTVTSAQAIPTTSMLELPQRVPASVRPYLNFSSPVASELRKIAQRVTRYQHTAFGKAVALERWFHSNLFTYSLQSTLPDSGRGLLTFLTTDRQGFCQQFAFAMAVLARLLDIPARVVVGYTAGAFRHGQWVVTTADAHAWPELWFRNVGWLRFEPTPGGRDGQGTAVEPSYVMAVISANKPRPGGGTGPTGPVSTHGRTGLPGSLNKLSNLNKAQDAAAPTPFTPPRKGSSLLLPGLVALGLILLGTGLPGTARMVLRRRRWRTAASDFGLAQAAWREVRADLTDLGMPCRASESPRAVARQVCSATDGDDAARQAIGRITAVVERAYYASAPASATTVRSDVALVRRSLASSAGWNARWRARLLPASVLRPARRAIGQRLGMITGWVPTAGHEAAWSR